MVLQKSFSSLTTELQGPQFFQKWKTASIFKNEMGRQHKFFKMEDNKIFSKWKTTFYILANGRRPQFIGRWKMASILWKMEDNLNISGKGK